MRVPPQHDAPLLLELPLGAGRAAPGLVVVLLNPFSGDRCWAYRYHTNTEGRAAMDSVDPAQQPRPPDTCQLALLASLARGGRGSSDDGGGDASGGGDGGCGSWGGSKALDPSVSASAAFKLIPSGSRLNYSVVPLDTLLGGSGSKQQAEVRRG